MSKLYLTEILSRHFLIVLFCKATHSSTLRLCLAGRSRKRDADITSKQTWTTLSSWSFILTTTSSNFARLCKRAHYIYDEEKECSKEMNAFFHDYIKCIPYVSWSYKAAKSTTLELSEEVGGKWKWHKKWENFWLMILIIITESRACSFEYLKLGLFDLQAFKYKQQNIHVWYLNQNSLQYI